MALTQLGYMVRMTLHRVYRRIYLFTNTRTQTYTRIQYGSTIYSVTICAVLESSIRRFEVISAFVITVSLPKKSR